MLYMATGKLQRRAFWLVAEEAVMGTKKIYVDDHNRELSAHGTETFPVTVNHDDLWMFEGRNVPIHCYEVTIVKKRLKEISVSRQATFVFL